MEQARRPKLFGGKLDWEAGDGRETGKEVRLGGTGEESQTERETGGKSD
jgi:hypothetical protein